MARQDRFAGVRWRIGSAIAGAVGALAYLVQIVVGFTLPMWARWALAGLGTVLLFFSIAQPNWQVGREVRARKAALATANEAVAAYDIKVHKLLVPLSGLLAKIIAERDVSQRRFLQEKMKQVAVDCALDNMQGEPRSCFYTYHDSAEADKRKLVLDGTWRGRNTRPRNEFAANGDDAAKEALRVLDTHETKFVRDADSDPPPGWKRDCDYRTYIHAAVVCGTVPFGLLTVDAVEAGDLTELDVRLVELLAILLGCALGAGSDNSPNPAAHST